MRPAILPAAMVQVAKQGGGAPLLDRVLAGVASDGVDFPIDREAQGCHTGVTGLARTRGAPNALRPTQRAGRFSVLAVYGEDAKLHQGSSQSTGIDPSAPQITLSAPWRASAADQTFSVNRKYFILSCICAQKQYVDLQLNLQLNLHLNLQHILFLRAYA